ncbi:alanine racemase, partial [Streptomyces hundungensis]
MALTLYVDSARWRAHQKSVIDQFPGIVPVCKGNGYGFGHERLADEVSRFGSDILAVGTTYEAAKIKDWFSGDLLVLTPFRRGEEPVPLPDRVIRSVSSVDGVHALVGHPGAPVLHVERTRREELGDRPPLLRALGVLG